MKQTIIGHFQHLTNFRSFISGSFDLHFQSSTVEVAAMDLSVKSAMEAIKSDPALAINLKVQKILQLLSDKGCMYTQVLQPHLLIVHSQNRSGMMLNSFDCHEKGLMALKVGWQESKVADSYCFEMSQNKAKKDSQMSAMQKLVQSSEKRLAPVTGQERFMTVSCSHMSQFAKAAGSGQCVSELPELETFSMEAIDAHFADEQFQKMVKDGWQWNVIQADVEEGCPWFPQMLQASLNTGNQIVKQSTEMEIAMAISYLYKAHKSFDKAIQLAQSATPSSYLPVIALYMKNFGGGDDFPVLVFLQAVQKLFNSSLKLGEEFMTALAQAEFKSKDSTYPMVRAALIAANLSSPKVQDGIAKLLVKSDIDKAKSPSQRAVLDLTEKLLRLAFDTMHRADPAFEDKNNVKHLAKLFIRSALFVVKKEGKGRESKVYGSLDAIHEKFEEEAKSVSQPLEASAATSSASSSQPEDTKVWSLQAGLFHSCICNAKQGDGF